ncbi:hypothetical protein ACFFTN_27535 [Aminobacter aganoensis]|uniref:Uncharacterized protein n=1 Tax=Aminobacter aganoensis TaxID=83264 RepID=A0A7X0FDC7_9HYPH|nr:hypothetical protein [Aminobacter aganoensis]MBB6357648.1 hypothetical protein [Aminobacter aganoensis]
MNDTNSTSPNALANSQDARASFQEVLASPAGIDALGRVEVDVDGADAFVGEIAALVHDPHATDEFIISSLDEKVDKMEGAVQALRHIRDAYIDARGVPNLMLETARALHRAESRDLRDTLKRYLDLTRMSDRKMTGELVEALTAIGMPRTFHGRVINTYPLAAVSSRDWIKGMLHDLSGRNTIPADLGRSACAV